MKTASSKIWTRVTVFISNDDNHYTTNASLVNYDILHSCISSIVNKKCNFSMLNNKHISFYFE